MKKTLNLLALAALPLSAMAATNVWDGAGDGSTYEDGGNWGGTAPTDDLTTDVAQFTGGTVDLSTTRQVSGLDFDTGSTLSGTGSIEIGADGINVGGNSIINTAGLVLNQPNTTINFNGGRLSWGTGLTASGTGALTLSGNNILYVDGGANTYSGGTIISNGATASIKNSGALGTGTITFDNGTLRDNNTDFNLSNAITVNSGGGTVQMNGNISSSISGAGALTIIGEGKEKLFTSTGNTHSGGITLDNAFFRTSGSDSYGVGAVTLKNGSIIKNNDNSLTFLNDFVLDAGSGGGFMAGWSKSVSVDGVISGDGDLTIHSDSGTINLNGDNTYTGDTTIQGNVSGNSGSFGDNATAGSIFFDGGKLVANNHFDLGTRAVTLTGDANVQVYNSRNLTIAGVVGGAGKLTVDDDGGTVILRGNNTYSGGTDINGNVQVEHGDSLGTGDILIDNGGRVKNDDSAPVLANNVTIGSGGGRLMAGWSKDTAINGVVSGSGTLTIDGDSGFVVLGNANNTFSGDIEFTNSFGYGEGNLRLASIGSGSYDGIISGESGAQLELTGDILLNGDSTFAGLTTVTATGTLGGDGALDGDLTLDAGAAFTFSLLDTLDVAGTVTLDSTFGIDDLVGIDSSVANGTYTLIGETASTFDHIENFGVGNAFDLGDGKSAYFENGSLQVTVIPEPAALGLVAATGAMMLFIRRRFLI